MSAVARLLPRFWDGSRLLRFLTGLAMLTLAFTAHAQPAPEPSPPPAAVVSAASPAAVAVAEPAPAARPTRIFPAQAPATPMIIAFATLALLVGFASRVRGERAPPVA